MEAITFLHGNWYLERPSISLKDLSVLVFLKYIKRYLLSEQKQNQFFHLVKFVN